MKENEKNILFGNMYCVNGDGDGRVFCFSERREKDKSR